MDNLNKKENVKGVRLQGFKGFKLKNTQILFKTSFSRKGFTGKSHDKRSINISKLTTASTLPSISSFVTTETKLHGHKNAEKTLKKDADVAYFVNSNSSVKKLSPKISLSSPIKNHGQRLTSAIDSHSSCQKKKNINLSRKRESTSYDAQLPKKCQRSTSPQSSLSKSNLHITSKKKDSDDDDDDEVMRKIREKRRLNKKISETYTPQKKKEENEIYQLTTLNHSLEKENFKRQKRSGHNGAEATRNINSVFPDTGVSEQTVQYWFSKFLSCTSRLENGPRGHRKSKFNEGDYFD